jgi:hypothetical protein
MCREREREREGPHPVKMQFPLQWAHGVVICFINPSWYQIFNVIMFI